MRAVLDVNVIIAAALSPEGAPATVLRAWLDGAFEFVASPLLVEELERALGYPKIRDRIPATEAEVLAELICTATDFRDDPAGPPARRSPDVGDDYVLALAEAAQAVIVSGDRHLLGLAATWPVYSPADFLVLLGGEEGTGDSG